MDKQVRRKALLQNFSYPLAPRHSLGMGRVVRLCDSGAGQFEIDLHHGDKTSTYQLINIPEGSFPVDALVLGDIIYIQPENNIHMLSPNLLTQEMAHLQASTLPRKITDESIILYETWLRFLNVVKSFFSQNKFLEVQTPYLVSCPGTEPSLDPFELNLQYGAKIKKCFLPTSPELHLKKSMSKGLSKVFEIKTCFRNGEFGPNHKPEFFMLEWYRDYSDLQQIKVDLQDLILFIQKQMPELKKFPLTYSSYSLRELFQKELDFSLCPNTTALEFAGLLEREKINVTPGLSADDMFCIIFNQKIENQFNPDVGTFVENYPGFQSAYARLSEDGWAQRFEFYWQGLEIANAFQEVNNPKEQSKRFLRDSEKKAMLGKKEVPGDAEFLQALEAGFPPTAGIALGLERLFMACMQINEIQKIKI